jgi:hypothetical protein
VSPTDQFFAKLTVHTNKINPAITAAAASAFPKSGGPMAAVQRDRQHRPARASSGAAPGATGRYQGARCGAIAALGMRPHVIPSTRASAPTTRRPPMTATAATRSVHP